MISINFNHRRLGAILISAAALLTPGSAAPRVNTSTLPAHLESLQPTIFPPLQQLSTEIYNHPEIGRNETFAHAITVDFFQNTQPGHWNVFPNILSTLPTAWRLEFYHRPGNWPADEPLPTVGFMSEYDALVGIGHACGHHLIYLQGIYAANLARQALIDYDIAGRLVVVGTPDEEESCGKHDLSVAGVFEDSQVWLMAHPSIANAIQPMSSRQNIVVRIIKDTHFEAVKGAYNILVPLKNLTGHLPYTSSTAALVEDVGMFVCNVVQADITLGIVGADLTTVNNIINNIKAANQGYASTNFTVADDPQILGGGVAISFVGNAGHAAADNLGALDLSIDVFAALNASDSNLQFYLPHNTTANELDFTVDVRTRYTVDLQGVVNFVLGYIPTPNYTVDVVYPALEVDPHLGPLFVETIALSEYGSQDWPLSTFAPAATDAGWVQGATTTNGGNYTLESVAKAVLHANYNVCNETVCPFNHDPEFRLISGTEFAFQQTEKTARAIAQMAVELLNDPDLMGEVTGGLTAGPRKRESPLI